MRATTRFALTALLLPAGCIEAPAGPGEAAPPLEVGEGREVRLERTRLDLRGYQYRLDRGDVLRLPAETRRSLWLADIDVAGSEARPRLLEHALRRLQELSPADPSLGPAERNLVRLLQMTPATVDLRGTALQRLTDLAPLAGRDASEALAEVLGIGVDDPFLAPDALGRALVEQVVGSHPAAQTRRGVPDAAHPDGVFPLAPGSVPVTLEDVATDLQSLAARFGESGVAGAWHPGFLAGVSPVSLLDEGFAVTLRVSVNAVPYRGVDCSLGAVAAVSSFDKELHTLFDLSTPDWISVEGVPTEALAIDELTFVAFEDAALHRAGDGPEPAPRGGADVWRLAPFLLERVVAEAAYAAWQDLDFEATWPLLDGTDGAVRVTVEDGWLELGTLGDLGDPPRGAYLWDLVLEAAQVRLHDGPDPEAPMADRIPEGEASVRISLSDVEVGLSVERVVDAVRANLETDPDGILSLVNLMFHNGWGAPDLYLYRPEGGTEDWLWFVAEDDLPRGEGGALLREYGYARPGFYADEALADKVSTTEEVAGDVRHEKVRVAPGDVLYVEDDEGARFRLEVLEDGGTAGLGLHVGRVR